MIQKYIARKREKPKDSDTYYWSLYKFDPTTNIYHPDGKKRMSLGQLLCHINCIDLDNWQFIEYGSPVDGYIVTCYRYSSNSQDDIEIEVLEKNQVGIYRMDKRKITLELFNDEFLSLYHLVSCETENEEIKKLRWHLHVALEMLIAERPSHPLSTRISNFYGNFLEIYKQATEVAGDESATSRK